MNIKKTSTYIAVTLGLVFITSSLAYAYIPTQISTVAASNSKRDIFKPLYVWVPTPVADDPLVRMPGSQPGQVILEGPNRCLNCHSGYDQPVEPGFNWQGSLMAQAGRDFLFWSCLTVAGQDSIWAIGSPNAVDICERCHFPKGWLEGRSDPPNVSAITGADYDGLLCDFCHRMYDPFFETNYQGTREGNDWLNYWDETNDSDTQSSTFADATYIEDQLIAQGILLFNGGSFYGTDNLPFSTDYIENGGGQYFVSPNDEKRASFADADPRSHSVYYSRYHKSKYFCGTCHDVSNPVLANLDWDGNQPLNTEKYPANSYFHVERTFSEFMLSEYGQQGGAAGTGSFAPDVFVTSLANNYIARCQDCHMRDVVGEGCDKQGVLTRPTQSIEHPQSGLPMHDMTGGNAWVSYVLASSVQGSTNYNATNDGLLNQGANLLTLDLTQGQGVDAEALLASVERTKAQLQTAASIEELEYNPTTGSLSFRIQNHTGHKLISGFPEGRRMFVNIKVSDDETLIYEVNPYDYDAGTLKGLEYNYLPDPNGVLPLPIDINPASEEYLSELVYEIHPSSTLTGEDKTFHFALADGRSKDNRIPPMGFRINDSPARLVEPVWGGVSDLDYFSPDEYAGGYDAVAMTIPTGADHVEVSLYYQTTSREYIEFLRDEINGAASTLPEGAYIIQTDPFFSQLKAWGTTIWDLWTNNMDVPGAEPLLMAYAEFETVEHYDVTVTIIGNGIVNNTPGNPYLYDEIATLEPVADPRWTFSGWSGADASELVNNEDGTWNIVMDDDKAVIATFTQDEYTLTINSDHGTVAKSPDKTTYHYSEEVQLTVTPDSGWTFTNWSGDLLGSDNPGSILMNSDKTVTANYEEIVPGCSLLTLSHTGNGNNPVASPANSTGCPTRQYVDGESINLSGASPDTGWEIAGWNGTSNDSSTSSTNSLTMPASAHSAGVDYEQTCYMLTVGHNGNGSDPTASPTNSTGCAVDEYVYGENISLSGATPAAGWHIANWTGTNNNSSTESSNTVTMPDNNHTAEVNYAHTCYTLTISHTGNGSDPAADPDNSTGCPSGQYQYNESISLTDAYPDPGWHIDGWTGTENDNSNASSNNVIMPVSDHSAQVFYIQYSNIIYLPFIHK